MKVSFLLGAGFSRPAGYPLASELSKQILGVKAVGIATHSDGQAWLRPEFLAHLKETPEAEFVEPEDGFNWSNRGGVKALEAVLAVYSQTNPLDNYEHFYDELYCYYRKDPARLNALAFVQEYTGRGLHTDSARQGEHNHLHQALNMAFLIFPQLIEQLIEPNRALASANSGDAYQRFFNLIKTNIPRKSRSLFDGPQPGHEFCIHTLNHDLLVENWLNDEALSESIDYSDGFSPMGSPYFGRIDFDHTFPPHFRKSPHNAFVRMPRFTGKYDKSVQLLKLHGSLDYWSFGVESQDNGLYEPLVVRKQPWISHLNLFREVEADGSHEYRNDFTNYHPLFLSGTTAKMEQYTDPVLFSKLLKQFQGNLSDSDILVIVGYGFRDEGINRLIMPFLEDPQKKVIIIGREFPDYFPAVKSAMFHTGGLEAYDFDELGCLLKI